MRPEKQRLLHEVLDAPAQHPSPLEAGMRVLRRRRYWRTARQGLGAALVLALATVGLMQERRHLRRPVAALPPAQPSLPARQQSLTDDQLLALFPDTPVVLATLSDGKKRLIFPRPEDERRFVRSPQLPGPPGD